MPTRDANGNLVYSLSEYEHFNFMGEPFCGFVEGIGYTCTDIEVVASPFNKSGTQFMFDIQVIQYNLDMSDMYYQDEPTLSNQSQTGDKRPDRTDYWRMSNFYQMEYRDDNWKYLQNPVAFANNVLANIFDVIPWAVNSIAVPSQIGYHEGFDAFIDNEMNGVKGLYNAPINYVSNTYNYHTQTSGSQQWSDFKRDVTDVRQWERSMAFGVTLFAGGAGVMSKAGTLGKGTGMLTKVPAGGYVPKVNYFPIIRDEAGIFGTNGLIIRNYKIEAMYRNGGGGTIFSVKQMRNSGNLFRLDLHPHPNTPSIPLLHYHYRLNIGSRTFGSNAPRTIPFRKITITGATGAALNGDSKK